MIRYHWRCDTMKIYGTRIVWGCFSFFSLAVAVCNVYVPTWKCWCHLWPVVEIFNPQNILVHTRQWKMSLSKYVLINNHLTTHLIYTYTIPAPRYQIEFNGTWFWTGMHNILTKHINVIACKRPISLLTYQWNQVLDSRRHILDTICLQN